MGKAIFWVGYLSMLLWLATEASTYQNGDGFEVLLVFWIGGLIYFLPSIVAFHRSHPNRWFILALNVFLGSTGIAWLIGLFWACRTLHITNASDGTDGGESGLNLFANDAQKLIVEHRDQSVGSFANRSEVALADEPAESAKLSAVDHSGAQSSAIEQQLRRLRDLFDTSAIDDAEYKSLKSSLIDQLASRFDRPDHGSR